MRADLAVAAPEQGDSIEPPSQPQPPTVSSKSNRFRFDVVAHFDDIRDLPDDWKTLGPTDPIGSCLRSLMSDIYFYQPLC